VWFAEGHAAGARRNAAKRPAATAVCARPGRSVSGQRQAGRERGHIWLIGERAIRPPLGALLSATKTSAVWRVGRVIAVTAAMAVSARSCTAGSPLAEAPSAASAAKTAAAGWPAASAHHARPASTRGGPAGRSTCRHEALRDLTCQFGTLLGIDETHTHVVGPGGTTAMWQLQPDVITLGKAVAGGLPMGAYGVTAELGRQLDTARNIATGSTLFGNPLSAEAALTEVLVPGAYAHATALGTELGQAITSAGLPWTVIRLGPRSGQWYGPMPRTGAQAHALTDDQLTRLIRIWLANRGVWQALPGAGPTVPVPAARADVARYVEDYTELLAELY
jgi:Aminotransferase class-III